MTASDYLYCFLVIGMPFILVGFAMWAIWGKFDDELMGREDEIEYRRR